MASLVVSGAILHCTAGSGNGALVVGAGGRPGAGGLPVATIADHVGTANIRTFGACSSPGNPQVAAVGSSPCVPNTPAVWSAGSSSVNAGGLPVLNSNSKCGCQFGGQISILYSGQQSVTAG